MFNGGGTFGDMRSSHSAGGGASYKGGGFGSGRDSNGASPSRSRDPYSSSFGDDQASSRGSSRKKSNDDYDDY